MLRAADKGFAKTAELMISKGIVVDYANSEGFTALHFAAERSHVDVVVMLLMKGADIRKRNEYGWRPIDCAAKSGKFSMVHFLVHQMYPPTGIFRNPPLHELALRLRRRFPRFSTFVRTVVFYKRLVDLEPHEPVYSNILGDLYLKVGNIRLATDSFERALLYQGVEHSPSSINQILHPVSCGECPSIERIRGVRYKCVDCVIEGNEYDVVDICSRCYRKQDYGCYWGSDAKQHQLLIQIPSDIWLEHRNLKLLGTDQMLTTTGEGGYLSDMSDHDGEIDQTMYSHSNHSEQMSDNECLSTESGRQRLTSESRKRNWDEMTGGEKEDG